MTKSDRLHKKTSLNETEFKLEEIHRVVEAFYYKVQEDPLLKVPFQSVHDWPEHIQRLTHFWWLRFGGKPYMFTHYSPVAKHFFAGFNEVLLERWLKLFHETMQQKLNPNQCKAWTDLSQKMGQGLLIRNKMYGKAIADAQQRSPSTGKKPND